MRLLVLVLCYLFCSGVYCCVTGGDLLSPAAFVGATAPATLPAVGHALLAVPRAAAGPALHAIGLLARLRSLLRSPISKHDAHHETCGSKRPRAKMRRFKRYIDWDTINERFNDVEFRKAHGLNRAAFDHLLAIVGGQVTNEENGHGGARNGNPLPAELKLVITLRWLRGGSHHDLCAMYGLSPSCFYKTVWQVCRAICSTHELLLPNAVEAMRSGDDSALRRLARGFAHFTSGIITYCIGAVDGVQIWIKKPSPREASNPTYYFTRHHKFAINAQAIADSVGRVIWISLRAPGSVHDSLAFGMSAFAEVLSSGALGSFHLVGDDAYIGAETMLTPERNARPGSAEDNFNYFQSLTRQPVERCFGMIERRWGVLWRRLEVRLANVPLLVLTLCHLHNICVDFNVPDPESSPDLVPLARTAGVLPGRRRDLEGTSVLSAGIIEALATAGFRRPPIDGARRRNRAAAHRQAAP